MKPMAALEPAHFLWRMEADVAVIQLSRPERKNPLTFESYAELRDTFRDLAHADGVKAVVIAGAGGNFCSGGDVHEIIGPLVRMQEAGDMRGLLDFTHMTGDLVKASNAFMSMATSGPMMSCTSPPEQKLPPLGRNTTAFTSSA